jgi:hypothetical protein
MKPESTQLASTAPSLERLPSKEPYCSFVAVVVRPADQPAMPQPLAHAFADHRRHQHEVCGRGRLDKVPWEPLCICPALRPRWSQSPARSHGADVAFPNWDTSASTVFLLYEVQSHGLRSPRIDCPCLGAAGSRRAPHSRASSPADGDEERLEAQQDPGQARIHGPTIAGRGWFSMRSSKDSRWTCVQSSCSPRSKK